MTEKVVSHAIFCSDGRSSLFLTHPAIEIFLVVGQQVLLLVDHFGEDFVAEETFEVLRSRLRFRWLWLWFLGRRL